MSITFFDYLELALVLQHDVNSAVEGLIKAIDVSLSESSDQPAAAIIAAADTALCTLNHNGFHFNEWDRLARLLNLDQS